MNWNEATDEQINRAIHEKVMGECWHESEPVGDVRHGGYYCRKCGSPDKLRRVPLEFESKERPDHTTDLNAVALAEAKVIETHPVSYFIAIKEAVGVESDFVLLSEYIKLCQLTARQRSIAVLNAMEVENDN